MKQLLLLLLVMPCTLFGQNRSDDVLYNYMDNLKQDVISITELHYYADKDGKQEAEPYYSSEFLFNSNKQIKEITNYSIEDDQESWDFYSFEAASPHFTKQVIVESDFVHLDIYYSYTTHNTQTGSTIFKNYAENNEPFREFVLNDKQQVVALYEYFNGEKSFTGHLFEYNSQGHMVKKTRLYNDKPSKLSTYKLNEHGDIIEELEFDVFENKFAWKYEYTYTYDKYNNWLTKKKVMMGFDDKGKLKTKKNDYVYEFYTRELKYADVDK